MSRGRGLLLVGLVMLSCRVVSAQEPSDRLLLSRLQDSLALTRDTLGLQELEQRLIDRARADRENPLHHLQLGVLALRLAELLPNQQHLDDALGEFEWAAELRPDWPWPWYGLGLAEARGADRAAGVGGGFFVMLGLDRDQRAGAAFRRALEADPQFVGGILEFGRVALAQRIGAPVESALRSLRMATATPVGWDPDLLLVRGRLERLAGYPDSALAMFRRAERLGAANGLAWLEIARTLPLSDVGGGEERRAATTRAYLLGVGEATPDVMGGYLRDLEPIASPALMDSLRTEGHAERQTTLATFWRDRDARDLREVGARLAEHYRRWNVAMREFRLPPFRRRYLFGIERYRSGDTEFDDRGIVYVRQGEPSVRVRWPPNRPSFHASSLDRSYGSESWRYDRPDGPLELHFVAREDPQDYRLVDGPTALDVALDALSAHAHELPSVARLLRTDDISAGWVGEEVRMQGRRALSIATQTDRWVRDYPHLLSGKAQWWVAGSEGGRPLLHLIYALDAGALREHAAEGREGKVAVRVRAAVLTREGRPITTLDTVQWLATPSPASRLVAAHLTLPADPGRVQLRVGAELSADLGVVFPLDSILAPAPQGPRLDLSALLLGVGGRSLAWRRTPNDTVWIDAGGVFAPEDTLEVYLEAYGIRSGVPATVSITMSEPRTGLARLLRGRRTALTLTEAIEVPPTTPMIVERGIPLRSLTPGNYALEVTVSQRGVSVTRHRGLVVR